ESSQFLKKCLAEEVKGFTSVNVLAETLHRLMILEAIEKKFVSKNKPLQKIKKNLGLITKLTKYIEDVEKIPKIGIAIIDLNKDIVLESKKIRLNKGLMTNDSLIYTTMIQNEIYDLATFDNDFDDIDTITVYKPTDI
ncbi:MAG: PIN domain-containing protein, partial [Desulfobacterales bacterium]|nr:PIN domain-containing protein [Desulfobacterales bacterium]